MQTSLWLLALLFAAIAIGFLLGRLDRFPRRRKSRALPRSVDFLLGEPSDRTLRAMVENLDTHPDTLDTHLALGRLFRKRGELDRATLIHQGMLDNSRLPEKVREDVELELARDFLSAGLFDRAEQVLQHMVDHDGRHAAVAMRHLMSIFEQERDWHSALAIGERLLRRNRDVAPVLAQYCCELAERLTAQQELNAARRLLRRALAFDGQCVRASLLQGRLEIQAGYWDNALRALRRVRRQNPLFLDQVLDDLERCYRALGREEDMLSFLLDACLETPSNALVVRLAGILRERAGEREASLFLAQYMKKFPSVQGLNEIIEMNRDTTQGNAREYLDTLRTLTQRLLAERPVYHCVQCGFRPHALHWQCPGCKGWATIAPVSGAMV
ncbi:tetratricopeptide repeat protein [Isoalcanivorax pacificus W11-5]|uniref:Lipopolysaccharide assembly protein B n=1 Tax=Isoalcanivorax pacificus W11-5 TaxID=391936 RepID=A0A0B4XN98_9GAMM|nr:lipopolysaccharide assembly protein LapB [Isoalcanivorax pacificus]AJD48551.1 tetratricopeptide repeat protein [Isoalcanivorax pacificus W11-5]